MNSLKNFFVLLILLGVSLSCKRHYSGGQEEIPNTNYREPIRTVERVIDRNPEIKESTSSSVAQLFKQLEPSVFMIVAGRDETEQTFGSAFLINKNIGVTNHHVVENYNRDIYAYINDKFYPISVLKYSNKDHLDFAIFKINGFVGTPLKIARQRSEIGEDIFAIGSPKGLKNSLTKGTISGYRDNSRIQIDATIDHGSSGGALFNLKGEVIGITTSGVEGKELNFAVDIQAIPYDNYILK